ncbi:MAG: biopolymer transporter ExbD [Bdellovibrionales bacterium]|nr:biopolymer transporter ExbD [Bdellovibrionales bacterium]
MSLESSSQKRSVGIPGYHIRPKYDLKRFRERMNAGGDREMNVDLPLTSMIDMFSMLVIFLLLNFSSTGEAFFVNKNLKIPEAENAQPLESLPLISITTNSVSLDAKVLENDGTPIDFRDPEMPRLVYELHRLKKIQANFRDAGLKPKTQINIQADEKTPVLYVKRVMTILINEGFTGINFAVREMSSPEGQ